VAIVTKPFGFEGSRRGEQADRGIAALADEVDTLIVVPNNRLLAVLDKQTSMVEAFRVADDVLRQGVQGISDLVTLPGLINLDFADVRTIMSEAGTALLGIGMGVGENRAIEAAIRAGTALKVTAYDRANVTPLSVGKVEALDSQIDPTTGTVKLRANFDNLDDKLFPNQFVNARLLIKSLHGVVAVPSSAVQHGAPGTYVYLVGADDTVSARSVDLGPLDGAMFAVNAGLAPGDRVVVDGADRLRDGAKVLVSAAEGSNGGGTADAPAPGQKREQSGGLP